MWIPKESIFSKLLSLYWFNSLEKVCDNSIFMSVVSLWGYSLQNEFIFCDIMNGLSFVPAMCPNIRACILAEDTVSAFWDNFMNFSKDVVWKMLMTNFFLSGVSHLKKRMDSMQSFFVVVTIKT